MATGNRLVPGAPVTAEQTAAGRPITDQQAAWAAWAAQGSAAEGLAAQGPAGQGFAGQGFAGQGFATQPAAVRTPRRLWRGAGGRWMIWAVRAVLWAALLLIGYRGVAAIATGVPVVGGPADNVARGQGFPVALAKAYALQFGQAYLNFNPATARRRAGTLAGFLPPGTSPQDGWNGVGRQTLESEQVAGIRVLNAHRAVVMLLARVNGHLIEIGVPIYAGGGGMVVSGQPAMIPPPVQAVPPQQHVGPADLAARRSLEKMLPAFFRAYASGNALQLGKFTVRGNPITGLGGVVRFAGIRRLSVPAAAGPVRTIAVTVTWLTGSPRPATAGRHAARQPASPAATPSPKPSATASARSSASPAPRPTASASARPHATPSAKPSPVVSATAAPSQAARRTAGRRARPAEIDMTYALTVLRHGGTWLVRWIGPAAAQPWPMP
jgi:hypothetical protein